MIDFRTDITNTDSLLGGEILAKYHTVLIRIEIIARYY